MTKRQVTITMDHELADRIFNYAACGLEADKASEPREFTNLDRRALAKAAEICLTLAK
jgi:hypothetical protein